MCGICGFIDYKGELNENDLNDMVKSINYRGPDDRGTEFYHTHQAYVGLGHVRLSILDLTQAGHQPMRFENLTIVFNGEVYNFREIRADLIKNGHHFKSDSDTEVILHAFKEWKYCCVDKFIGMFAFVIFDNSDNTLYLCRDRAGVKPLYYYLDDEIFAFASELKPLMKLPNVKKKVSMQALSTFLKVGYIPGEMSVFENTYKLDGGCWAEFIITSKRFRKFKYWDLADYYKLPKLDISYEDAKESLKELFISAFGYRLISDVPVGVLQSGGFDSSAVTAILTRELGVTPMTFTVGFNDYVDEAPVAEKISEILGTKQVTKYCSVNDVVDIIPILPFVYDEPFSDTSALPSILVSRVVKQHVSVVLSADGGDEVFAGYNVYGQVSDVFPYFEKIPGGVRNRCHPFFKGMSAIIPSKMSKMHNFLDKLDYVFSSHDLSQKTWIESKNYYNQIIVNLLFPSLSNYDYLKMFDDIDTVVHSPEYALLSDWKTQMKDEFLIKIDRAMMSVSLEGREPMLDHRIAEFAAQLPWEYKYKDGVKKRILKDIVYDYLPKELMDKPKRGFSPPLEGWMRTILKDYVIENVMTVAGIDDLGCNTEDMKSFLNRFMKGDKYFNNLMWRIAQYGAWYKMYMTK